MIFYMIYEGVKGLFCELEGSGGGKLQGASCKFAEGRGKDWPEKGALVHAEGFGFAFKQGILCESAV